MKDKICLSCGGSMNTTERELARYYKQLYIDKGIVKWVVKRYKNAPIEFVRSESFKEIKKKLGKNAEYIHISEFKID